MVVARTGSSKSPVTMLERYYAMAAISKESKLRLLVSTKSGERLRSQGSLSYTRVREFFLQKLTSLGFDAKQFGLHSLRSGGATAAAQAGVPDRLFKRHGRWRSEAAKDSLSKFEPVILITRYLIPIICLTCCTASTTHKKSCVGACSHEVRVMSYERCMLREIYFLSFDVGIRRKICSRILRDATEGWGGGQRERV